MPDTLCDVCGSADIEELGRMPRRSFTKQGIIPFTIPVGICRDCGFCFMWPKPSWKTCVTVHQNVCYPNWGDNPSLLQHARNLYESLKEAIISLDQCHSILDIGCGEGHLLQIFKTSGKECFGVEVRSEINVERLHGKGIHIYTSPFQEITFQRDFDMIILDNVLEHIPAPSDALNKIRSILSPNGYVVILVPYLSEHSDDIFIPEHVNYFSQTSIANICKNHGFEAVISPTIETELSIYRKNKKNEKNMIRSDYLTSKSNVQKCISLQKGRISFVQNCLQKTLNKFFKEKKLIAFYGAGSYALNLIEYIETDPRYFLGFIDSNPIKRGRKLLGYDIYSLEDLQGMDCDVVIICTENKHFVVEIQQQLITHMKNKDCMILTMEDVRKTN